MQNRLLCLALVLAFSLAAIHAAQGQGDVHTVFGDRRANSVQDLQETLVKYPFTWETAGGKAAMTFKAGGTGTVGTVNFTWRAKSPQEVELTLAGRTNKAELVFDTSYMTYSGTDFDGTRPVHGTLVAAQAPVADASPAPLIPGTPPANSGGPGIGVPAPAATATPAFSNPFLSDHPLGDGGGDDGRAVLEKAITNTTFTWEPEEDSAKTVTFKAGGVGQNTFFPIAWKARNAHEVEVTIPTRKDLGKIVLRFSSDYTKYTATDFDGSSALKGHKVEK
ncbi:MAG TPA: hypothetical protein VG733_11165 [Chthoniobacteraceae bacterium]|nr:hypothetical protein [Chthoniobacteraceae bacterium]